MTDSLLEDSIILKKEEESKKLLDKDKKPKVNKVVYK